MKRDMLEEGQTQDLLDFRTSDAAQDVGVLRDGDQDARANGDPDLCRYRVLAGLQAFRDAQVLHVH